MSGPWSFADWRQARLQQVEDRLSLWVSPHAPAGLGEAMRYSVLGGGKRLRPLLVLATAEAVCAAEPPQAVWRAACAVELIHAYSLVHDDLPCMDNDVLRRGQPTAHVRFGEAQALLAGDALQALAFELLLPDEPADAPVASAQTTVRLLHLLARSAGAEGMAGGQAIDLASVGQALDQSRLEDMHRRKTGALLQASVLMGAAAVGEQAPTSPRAWQALGRFGADLGLAFQVVDDVLDVTADSATLGKTAGKDAASDKPTFVTLLGLPEAEAYAERLLQRALAALRDSGLPRTEALQALAHGLVSRRH
jgi:farnesyl diphosphate synthase